MKRTCRLIIQIHKSKTKNKKIIMSNAWEITL
jgi:hypothetical protein